MLDIKDELKNYKLVEFEENFQEDENKDNEEIKSLLSMFTKAYERIGKEQYKTSSAVDDILDMLEENNEINNQINNERQSDIKELKEQADDINNELKVMLNTVIGMSDIFDYMNNYVLNSNNENLKGQFKLVQEQLVEKLAKASIAVLGTVNGEVDINIHQPIDTRWQEDKQEGIILDVIRKGYIYKGKLLRKAEIIVNKNESF